MKTQAAQIPQIVSTAKSTVQKKSNAPAVSSPKVLPVIKKDIVQPKRDSSFSWMQSNKVVQQKATAKAIQPSRQTIVQPKAKAPVVQLKRVIQTKAIQPKIELGKPNDHYEQEADRVAEMVVNMPDQTPQPVHASPAKIQTSVASTISRFSSSQVSGKVVSFYKPVIQRQTAGTTNSVPKEVESRLNNSSGRGSPMDTGTRSFFEPRFGADFSNVRIHTDTNAAQLNNNLGSSAFAYGSDVYFNQNQYNPSSQGGRQLIAHELTHVVQQGGALRRKSLSISSSPRSVQRLGVSDVLNFFADAAYNIPGYRMFTIVIGVNPINMQRADRSAANILRAIVEFLPGGNIITRVLDRYGVLERAGAHVEQQLNTLGISGSNIRDSVMRFLDTLSWRDLFSLGSVWERARRIFTDPIGRIISFVRGLFNVIKQFIWDAVLRPLAALAANTRGYDLIKAILGRDPISGEPYPQTAETLIGGFMKLIGQEEVWENIKRGNAVARAFVWFRGVLSDLLGFVTQIPTLFITTLRSLELTDFLIITNAIGRIFGAFGNFVGRFISWAGGKVMDLLEILFSVVAPAAVPYLQRAAGAFRTIIRNPVGFIGNLVRAAMLGFRQFGTNFLRHLRTSLIQWLTGALPSVYIPQALNLREIIKFVLSVLGLTWQNIRQKLVRVVGETAVRVMETGFDLVVTLVTQGPAAAWERIREGISNLQQMVMDGIMNFVKARVVDAAITRLLSMLTPAGAFIQAIIAIYNTVMFFVERLRQIAQVAAAFIDSISAIASGSLGAAANRVEQTMAGLLTLVISFLARIAGLGRVSDAVMEIINRVRAPIDRALDRVVDWIVNAARRLGRFVAQAGVPTDPNERLRLAAQTATAGVRRLSGRVTQPILVPILAGIRVRYGLNTIEPYQRDGNWWVRIGINPIINHNLGVPSLVGPDGRTPLSEHQQRASSARPAEGATIQPLIGKLSQCVAMFTNWARRGTSPVAQPMLRQLEIAREEAQTIGEMQGRGVPPSQIESRKQALAARLRTIQGLDPGYALISIGELSVTLVNARRQMALVVLPAWTMLNPTWQAEYERQLRDQQDGINSMIADQWQQNRNQYLAVGRSAVGASMQRTFQRRSGRVPSTAAPHNPDQGPGGFPDPTGIPASTVVNSHIGSQWPSRIPIIDSAVNAIDPAAKLITQMNFRLNVI